ncbi:PhoB family transcriptional regulator [Paenibacillus darwinianus]|uniref:PhoB family transcriptional regulator n=1 Tax=Paenibacillus darwinianus TaxID=1380763 RepID=A0A9W5RZ39_9BACL|nr:response regulator transcription factor [Paenibacillus darwinianus]EXX86035.1 PhoB family transcriptional regulator [Paenibacillus darwinianus]EXX86166.1 PhoB family transcriptional regulator [Paenibacillus darwinianus]EXX86475.1 PhoB family transcriptional regulator [Paenibacillus darwinianus]
MRKVLLIEDEPNFARFVELELEHEGFEVTVIYDGRKALELAEKRHWDLILLDLMLPGLNGIEICRRIRSQKITTPIIMLTARNSVMDRVSGLDSGADDYLPKPFAIEELLARIRSLLRRVEDRDTDDEETLTFLDLRMNAAARAVLCNDLPVELTKREFDLLLYFIQHQNTVMSRERLLNGVWGFDAAGIETNIVDVYVRYVRQKLNAEEKERYIQTVRGVGYIMKR